MPQWALLLCVLAAQPTGGVAWLYADSATWPSTNPGCGTLQQSPINIVGADALQEKPEQSLSYEYTPFGAGELNLVNDAHFFGVNGHFGVLKLPDGDYNALQLRLHFPSEHTVDGRYALGELQIFHQKEGAVGNDDLAVVSILLSEAKDDERALPSARKELDFFQSFGFTGSGNLPTVQAQAPNNRSVDLNSFAESLTGPFYHYRGSLTSPPCFQGISWYVTADVAGFPALAIPDVKARLTELISRPTQPLNGRTVVSSALALPAEFPEQSHILFDCKANPEWWSAPHHFWCCREEKVGCPAKPISEDVTKWPVDFPQCEGNSQSPVNFELKSIDQSGAVQALNYHYMPLSRLPIVNDGRSLQIAGLFGFMILPNGPHDVTHLRLRFPAEHGRNAKAAAGELQIVHHRRGCSEKCSAIIAVPLNYPGEGEAVTEDVSKFFGALSLGSAPDANQSSVVRGHLDLTAFEKELSGPYFHYVGSLTEPPCTDGVHWYVLDKPVMVPPGTGQDFTKHLPDVRNRPVQPLNQREVTFSQLSLPGEFPAPQDVPGGSTTPMMYDCKKYQPDPAISQWCRNHAPVKSFRVPDWSWSYDDPAHWPSVDKQCAGDYQSPIDFRLELMKRAKKPEYLRYDYYSREAAGERSIINDGQVLRVDGDFGVMVFTDGTYEVKHCFIRFPSEHKIDGTTAAGELQIMHQKKGSHGMDNLAMVSLFLVAEDVAGPEEANVREFFTSLGFGKGGKLPEPGQELGSFGKIDLKVFDKQLKTDYLHYKGSLTVPPCTEGVHWYVMRTPVSISNDVIESMAALFPHTNHSRPVQPVNNRTVVISKMGFPHEFDKKEVEPTTTAASSGGIDVPFDCEGSKPPSAEKREWCCGHKGKLCLGPGGAYKAHTTLAPSYDCQYGFDHWEKWTLGKKSWCCKKEDKACNPFDCDYDFDRWQAAWNKQKKEWCCHWKSRGCHDRTDYDNINGGTTGSFFHCSADYDKWEHAWSEDKRQWCCKHEQKGCHKSYDCATGYPASMKDWSNPQKAWCCQHHSRGCPLGIAEVTTTMTTSTIARTTQWLPDPPQFFPRTITPKASGVKPVLPTTSGIAGPTFVPRTITPGHSTVSTSGAAPAFAIEDPATWPDKYAGCRGNIQSPISITPNLCERGPKEVPLTYHYTPAPAARLSRQQYGFEVDGSFGTLELPDGTYAASKVTFHFPAEHAVDGSHSAGEMQIVHKQGERTAVVSVLLATKEEAQGLERQQPIADFFTKLTPLPESSAGSPRQLDLNVFQKQLVDKYYHYAGSVTTPPCTEMAHWYVLEARALVDKEVIDGFKQAFGGHENRRPLQELNGRQIIVSSLAVPGEFFDRKGGWNYVDANQWPKNYPKCAGKAQSPVFIHPASVHKSASPEGLKFDYHPVNSAMIVNNGHDIEVRGPFGTLKLPDGVYEAAEFRFHFPSEHKVQEGKAVGELQIIHERHGSMEPGLAGISILLTEAPVADPGTEGFFSNLGFGPSQNLPGRTAELESKSPVDLNAFKPQLVGGYYHYQGSLTLPPCLEGVHWYILKDVVAISSTMLKHFQQLFPDPGNNRPLQPLNDRTVVDSLEALPHEFPVLKEGNDAPSPAPTLPPMPPATPAPAPVVGGGAVVVVADTSPKPATTFAPVTAGPTHLPVSYMCDLEMATWEKPWSEERRDWCCKHEHKGCAIFHCDVGTKEQWSMAKIQWCCRRKNIGCALEEPTGWSYGAPGSWPIKFPSCGGKLQSPIGIGDTKSTSANSVQHLTVSYYPLLDVAIKNSGLVLRVAGRFGQIALPDGMYEAKEIRFHFPAEHRKDGLFPDGEMQIVHQRSGSAGFDDLAIISLLLQVGQGDAKQMAFFENLGFGKQGGLPAKGGNKTIAEQVDLGDFDRQFHGRYFHYQGSLTTPPCSETVHWFVLDEVAHVSGNMIAAFKALFPDPANNRPVQPRNGRPVVDSRIKVQGSCEYRHDAGCEQNGGLAGWFMGLLGQKYETGTVLPSAPTSLWLAALGSAMTCTLLAMRVLRLRARRREQYLTVLSPRMPWEEEQRVPIIVSTTV